MRDPAFELIVSGVRRVTPLEVMVEAAEEQMAAEPGEHLPEGIVRRAWSLLPADALPEAMEALFYAYWECREARRAEAAARAHEGGEPR